METSFWEDPKRAAESSQDLKILPSLWTAKKADDPMARPCASSESNAGGGASEIQITS